MTKNAKRRRDAALSQKRAKRINRTAGDPTLAPVIPAHGYVASLAAKPPKASEYARWSAHNSHELEHAKLWHFRLSLKG